MQHKLKIGLVLSDTRIPAWQHAMLAEIVNSNYAMFDVRILPGSKSDQRADWDLASFLFGLIQKSENKTPIACDACKIVDVSDLIGEIDSVRLPANSTDKGTQDLDSPIEQLQTRKLDVILALDDISSIESLIGISKYGVWFYDYSYGNPGHVDTSWIGFEDVLRRRPTLRSALIIRSATFDGDKTANDSYSSVNPLSHAMTRNEHLWKIRALVPRALRQLHIDGDKPLMERIRSTETVSQSDRQLSIKPSGPVVLYSLITYMQWRLRYKLARRFFTEKWILMFQLGGDSKRMTDYVRLLPPKDWFWADPHIVQENQRYFIFFEEASVTNGKGHIAVIGMDESGKHGEPTRILERPYHLSYPFIFEWQQNRYMTVESAENRTIEVYRCISFPNEWQFECTLMENVEAYDATLLEHNDTWWLFANVREHAGASTWDELCIFFSDNPLSRDWRPHPMNPVISDVRRARPAGRIFEKDGHLYRPSQNSSQRYGYGLNFNEILELTHTTYNERLVDSFEPNWDRSIRALHTFSTAGELAFVDAIYRTGKFRRRNV